jgi:signal transduction histidine kinase
MSTAVWAATVVSGQRTVAVYLFPAIDLTALNQVETSANRKLFLELRKGHWQLSGANLTDDELNQLLSAIFKDLVKKSLAELEEVPPELLVSMRDYSATSIVKALIADKQELIASLVSEQESIKADISREIHDTVIGDILLVQRALADGSVQSDHAELAKYLESAEKRLRALCADLSPRDIHEWGLKLMLSDLVTRFEARTKIPCEFTCNTSLPDLPQAVELQLFRITQEALTNAAKHSKAANVSVTLQCTSGKLAINISDNGVGYELRDGRQRTGYGTAIMRERIAAIRTHCHAALTIQSQPGQGTLVIISLDVP